MAEEVSSATQAVLAVAGVSALVLALWIASLVVRAAVALARCPAAKPAGSSGGKAAGKATKGGRKGAGTGSDGGASDSVAAAHAPPGKRAPDLKTLIKQSQAAKKSAGHKEDMAAHHPLFLAALRGHTDAVVGVGWAPDGRRLVTACEDSHLRVYDLKDLATNRDPKFKWLETQKAPLACGAGGGDDVVAVLQDIDKVQLALLRPTKVSAAGAVTYDTVWEARDVLQREPLLEAFVAPGAEGGGRCAALLSAKKFGRVHELGGGRQLGGFEPNSLGNHGLAMSSNGRFLAVASFTAEVKVWEVEWTRDGCRGVSRAMDLKGHTRKVMSVAISPDGSRAASASEDGSLRLWKLDVRYHLKEDAKTLLTVPLSQLGLAPGQVFSRLAWGPDGCLAAAHGAQVHFVDAAGGVLLGTVQAHELDVKGLAWAPAARDVGGGRRGGVLATCGSDHRVRLWASPKAAAE